MQDKSFMQFPCVHSRIKKPAMNLQLLVHFFWWCYFAQSMMTVFALFSFKWILRCPFIDEFVAQRVIFSCQHPLFSFLYLWHFHWILFTRNTAWLYFSSNRLGSQALCRHRCKKGDQRERLRCGSQEVMSNNCLWASRAVWGWSSCNQTNWNVTLRET